MRGRYTVPVLLCLVFVMGSMRAQNPPAPIAPNEPATPDLPSVKPLEVPDRTGISGESRITLDEVIRKVLENDRDLEVARIAADEAVFNVTGAKGYYDPILGLNAFHLKSVTPVASLIGGSADGKLTQKELYADPQLNGSFPWLGGTYALDLSSARQTTDSTFTTLNPTFPTSLNLNLTQPLWRGLRFDANRYRLEQSAAGEARHFGAGGRHSNADADLYVPAECVYRARGIDTRRECSKATDSGGPPGSAMVRRFNSHHTSRFEKRRPATGRCSERSSQ